MYWVTAPLPGSSLEFFSKLLRLTLLLQPLQGSVTTATFATTSTTALDFVDVSSATVTAVPSVLHGTRSAYSINDEDKR